MNIVVYRYLFKIRLFLIVYVIRLSSFDMQKTDISFARMEHVEKTTLSYGAREVTFHSFYYCVLSNYYVVLSNYYVVLSNYYCDISK